MDKTLEALLSEESGDVNLIESIDLWFSSLSNKQILLVVTILISMYLCFMITCMMCCCKRKLNSQEDEERVQISDAEMVKI